MRTRQLRDDERCTFLVRALPICKCYIFVIVSMREEKGVQERPQILD